VRRSYSSNSSSERRERALILGGLGLVVLVLLVGRLFVIQVLLGESSRLQSERNWLRPELIPGQRGRILDRNGEVLADVVPSYSIVLDPQADAFTSRRASLDTSMVHLAALLGDGMEDYQEELRRTGRFSYHPVRLHRNADLRLVTLVEENRSRLPGISVLVDSRRHYPNDSLAVHVLGYVNEVSPEDIDKSSGRYHSGSQIGRTGIEAQFEDVLRGVEGIRYVAVNVRGRRSDGYVRTESIPPQAGRDVMLTLDLPLQRVLEQAMDHAPYDGRGPAPEVRGAGVVLDVRNGDVLAMASRPGFDPNMFSRRLTPEEYAELLRPERPFYNRVVQGRYPPGSVIKGLSLYAGLDRGILVPARARVSCTGEWRFGRRVFRCWNKWGHGPMDALDAMAHSCDVYFYSFADELGVDGISSYAQRFRLAEPTGIDLPGEAAGLVPDRAWYDRTLGRNGWSRGVALNLIIGQGEMLLTPIEMAEFTAILAARGTRPTPHLLLACQVADPAPVEGETGPPEFEPVVPRRETLALDPKSLDVVRQGMRRAVESGTAKSVRFPQVAVAAKTGTAENAGMDHAAFIAFAPMDDPEIAIVVYLENRGHGGAAAAPVAREVLAAYFGISDSLRIVAPAETD